MIVHLKQRHERTALWKNKTVEELLILNVSMKTAVQNSSLASCSLVDARPFLLPVPSNSEVSAKHNKAHDGGKTKENGWYYIRRPVNWYCSAVNRLSKS